MSETGEVNGARRIEDFLGVPRGPGVEDGVLVASSGGGVAMNPKEWLSRPEAFARAG